MQTALILLQEGATGGGFGGYTQFILIGGMILAMYFLMIRPQQRKQKEQKRYIEELKKGDTVVTIGGMHGKIHEIGETTITLDVDRGHKITFEKTSISNEASQRLNKDA